MSDLKTFVCIAVLVLSASKASADHGYWGNQGSGCGRSAGYPQMSGNYGMNRLGYSTQGNYGGSATPWNSGYGAPQRFNNTYNSYGSNGAYGFQDQYRHQAGYGYDMDDRRASMGRNSYGYGNQYPSRGASGFYDSLYGDYHTNSTSGAWQGNDHYRPGSQGQYHAHGANSNFRW